MRFLHTADWHLGRLFHGKHLTEDQAYLLERLLEIGKESRPDAVIVAGDIYDRAVPPPEAVQVLDDVLSRLVLGSKVPVILIAGNHDSPDRLGFGSRLLTASGLHVIGPLPAQFSTLVLQDKSGPVHFFALPYAEVPFVRAQFNDENIVDHQSAMKALIAACGKVPPRSVLIGHAFVAGGAESESERPLSVGGSGTVTVECFSDFDYVALGHLHAPQQAGAKHVRYSGSLMKYSFSESTHQKSVSLVEMDASGACSIEQIALVPKRDVRCVTGLLNEILAGPKPGENREDYLQITLTDDGAMWDVMGRLREVYPNVLHVERTALQVEQSMIPNADHRGKTEQDLFSAFFSQVTEKPLSDEQCRLLQRTIEEIRRSEREVPA